MLNYFQLRRFVVALDDARLANTTPTKIALPVAVRQMQIAWFIHTNERMNWDFDNRGEISFMLGNCTK